MSEKRAMPRGLSALMADVGVGAGDAVPGDRTAPDRTIAIDLIEPNPEQPRRSFDEEKLSELASSIAERGVIQPLIVRVSPRRADRWEIVAGERRWRAAQRAGLHEVPVVVRQFDDTEVLEVAIIENIQRDDLNAIEEAEGYTRLMDRFGQTQEQLSRVLGKSRSHLANAMRLLKLPSEVRDMVASGALSAGHARALIGADDPVGLARRIVEKGLTVRDAERLAKGEAPKASAKRGDPEIDADTRALAADLAAALGLGVSVEHRPGGEAGKVVLSYRTLDELDRLSALLSRGLGDQQL
jgi:ParB family chromosome partitioning protein